MASKYITANELEIDSDAMSEANAGMLLQFMECGGIFEDVLEFLKEHDIQKEEYIDEIKPLIRKNAQLGWYKLVFEVIENRTPVIYWLNNIIDYFNNGISCEETAKALEDSKKIHHMSKIKSKILDKDKSEDSDKITDLIRNINNVLSIFEKESLKKEKQLPLLEEKILSLEKNLKFYKEELSRKDNVISSLKENNSDSKEENIKEQLEYYRNAWEIQVNENAVLKDKNTDLNIEIKRLKDEDATNENLSNVMVGYVKNTYEKMINLEEELNELKQATEKRDVPEKFLNFIEQEFNVQKNNIDTMLTEKLDCAFEKISVKENELEENIEENKSYESEASDVLEKIEFERIEENPEPEEKGVPEDKTSIVATLLGSKRFKKEIKKPEDTKEDKKRFLIEFFEEKKLDRLVNKFVKLEDEKEQISAIKAQILKRSFKTDVILAVNTALKDKKVTNEFIYSLLINNKVDSEEISMLLVE